MVTEQEVRLALIATIRELGFIDLSDGFSKSSLAGCDMTKVTTELTRQLNQISTTASSPLGSGRCVP